MTREMARENSCGGRGAKIAILNYNAGNLASVKNALLSLGVEAEIVAEAADLGHFDKLILPGVGAFASAMEHLRESGLDAAVADFAASKKPLLGICLGMQLLFEKSYEFGEHRGLGLLEGEVRGFSEDLGESSGYKVPHMGWNRIAIVQDSPLLAGLCGGNGWENGKNGKNGGGESGGCGGENRKNFGEGGKNCENGGENAANLRQNALDSRQDTPFLYFVHSFFVRPKNAQNIVATCDYGARFAAVVQKENIFGIQPHPEKSARVGLKILQNFIELA